MRELMFASWAACVLLAAVWLWLTARPKRARRARPDPYAGAVASFRRELHDWDRAGGWPDA